jgi:hypothetical protein
MGGLRSAGRKDGELSISGVASPGDAGYDFLRQSIANRLAWRTKELGIGLAPRQAEIHPAFLRALKLAG